MNEAIVEDLQKCVRCGSCKALCPTYDQDAIEPMSARGRLILLHEFFSGRLSPTPLLNERIFSCLLCGMCEDSCAVGVRITEAIYMGRVLLSGTDLKRRNLRRILRLVLNRPGMSYRAAVFLRPLLAYFVGKGALPFRFSLPTEPLRAGLDVFRPQGGSRGRVAIFAGCAVNYIYPHLGESLISVLLRAGFEVVLPGGEACCGAPLRAAGLEDDARRLAKQNIEAFGRLKVDAILSLCPTCTLSLNRHYPELAGQGLENAQDVSEFLLERVELPHAPHFGTVAYHDPCHLRYGLGVWRQPREILGHLGYDLIDPVERGCCGFSLSFTHGGISTGLLDRLLPDLDRADTVVTSCPGCIAQISRTHRNVIHLIEAVDAAMDPHHANVGMESEHQPLL
jgi:glycolate oxidase iron-sulfur subunit